MEISGSRFSSTMRLRRSLRTSPRRSMHLPASGSADCRRDGRTAEAARHADRASLGHRLRRAAPVSGAQPDFVRLAAARHSGGGSRFGQRRSRAGYRRPGGAIGRRQRSRKTGACAILPTASGCRPARAAPNTMSRSSAVGRQALRRRSTARRKGCAPSWSSGRRPAGRPARRRASRTISAFPAAFRATSLPAARFSRRGGWALKSWSRAPSPASIRRRTKCFSTEPTSSGRAASSSRPA